MIEEDVKRVVRGPSDLEEQIDQLKKQVELLQRKCRQAGKAILDLDLNNMGLKKEIDRLAEENDNLKIILKGKQNGKE
jgi:peptidoglycan hydrolase CwlO-like protein